jgi:hypothetical protein
MAINLHSKTAGNMASLKENMTITTDDSRPWFLRGKIACLTLKYK